MGRTGEVGMQREVWILYNVIYRGWVALFAVGHLQKPVILIMSTLLVLVVDSVPAEAAVATAISAYAPPILQHPMECSYSW